MITTNTVFILGAGASMPYGYPSGKKLRKQIFTFAEGFLSRLNYESAPHVEKQLLLDEAKAFVNNFEKSSIESIDRFLNFSPEYADIGKAAIILCLLDNESKSGFREKAKDPDDDWYFYLFQKMTEGITSPHGFVDFKKNNVTFITFNYDRSLEQFLYESLLSAFKRATPEQIKEQVQSIPIHHVYGQFCSLPWQNNKNGTLAYVLQEQVSRITGLPCGFIDRLKSNIKLIQERTEVDKNLFIRSIQEAERIFFLGFAYAQENLEILGIPESLVNKNAIYGTALHFNEREIHETRKSLNWNQHYGPLMDQSPFIKAEKCLSLLRREL